MWLQILYRASEKWETEWWNCLHSRKKEEWNLCVELCLLVYKSDNIVFWFKRHYGQEVLSIHLKCCTLSSLMSFLLTIHTPSFKSCNPLEIHDLSKGYKWGFFSLINYLILRSFTLFNSQISLLKFYISYFRFKVWVTN